jgi:hypothetical protein
LLQLVQAAILYPANPRPSYADHVLALFAQHGMSIRVSQWANELQNRHRPGGGGRVTLVPAFVQQQHRTDIEYVGLLDSGAEPDHLSAAARVM